MSFLAPVGAFIAAKAGTIGTIAMAAGTAASAWGSIQGGRIQEATARMNARMEAQRAQEEQRAAALDEYRHRRETRRILSTQKSLFLKGGVTMEGTPLDVIAETAGQAELDALMIRQYGVARSREAMGRAAIYRAGGRAAREAGYVRAGTTLLTGGGRILRGM